MSFAKSTLLTSVADCIDRGLTQATDVVTRAALTPIKRCCFKCRSQLHFLPAFWLGCLAVRVELGVAVGSCERGGRRSGFHDEVLLTLSLSLLIVNSTVFYHLSYSLRACSHFLISSPLCLSSFFMFHCSFSFLHS